MEQTPEARRKERLERLIKSNDEIIRLQSELIRDVAAFNSVLLNRILEIKDREDEKEQHP